MAYNCPNKMPRIYDDRKTIHISGSVSCPAARVCVFFFFNSFRFLLSLELNDSEVCIVVEIC